MMVRSRRTCIGCRRVTSPDALVRLAVRPGGGLELGRGRPGRGAWLCAGSVDCFEVARRRRAFGRALRSDVTEESLSDLRGTLVTQAEIEATG